ncbi:MAG: MBL fold metallo-hydrolase [Deltaproteobacteria bacterium]|nr:MBL fold metallo-hydrolase [Deltaproteobacteria bacterium]
MFFNAPPYRGPESDHFDGTRFRNLESTTHGTPGSLLKWMMNRDRGPWTTVAEEPGPPPPERVSGQQCRVTFVGHATLLVQVAGLNLLTDPVWAERVGPRSKVGPKRYRRPGLRFEDLPPIDAVLLSHNHYDHLCEATMRRLATEHQPTVITGLGNAQLLSTFDVDDARDLDWWEHTTLDTGAGAVRVSAVPMRHFSGRGPGDRDRTLWCGLHVAHPSGGILFAGDTGYGEHFAQIRERLGAPRVALLPIGAYRPRFMMQAIHVDPAEAVQAHLDLGATTSIAMHFGTFPLADDGMDEPTEDLADALAERGVGDDDFRVIPHGVGVNVP